MAMVCALSWSAQRVRSFLTLNGRCIVASATFSGRSNGQI